MPTNRPLPSPLPADLPEDWQDSQIVAPEGVDVGLTEQHGYNYLMKQVNDAQRAANQLGTDKQDKLTGTQGQVVGFDVQGNAVPQPGVGRSMAGQSVEPTQGTIVTAGVGAEVFNDYQARVYNDQGVPIAGNVASGEQSHVEGVANTVTGAHAHAEGELNIASGEDSHVEGEQCVASGTQSHAEGYLCQATDFHTHAEGRGCVASGQNSHAEGRGCIASGMDSHAEGAFTVAGGIRCHVSGYCTEASQPTQYVIGVANVISSDSQDKFIIGRGNVSNNNEVTSRANCFRVNVFGVYANGAYNSSGADYAELFEWQDGNPDNEDRAGLFVTLDGEHIRIAGPDDDYILGIVSATPSVVGDVYDDQWQGMEVRDVFGRTVMEMQDFPAEIGPNGEEITPARRELAPKINPDYDHTLKYQPRTQRPEWAAVGLLGKLVAVDDGSCQVNGWATVGVGGVATTSPERTKYRIMARLDDTHVRVMIL